ncbi:quinate permease [Aspergillus nomiae NRRL 13137]|uniref:Quinate transporter n=1 Tax=Aspergillus nomiae NRRL (strain ATCC 15546 / NRRL 13137 / CBS 260.88 / M93) TaxID=1509407 RepID=A0A0L1IXW0_ASPN3|nr:quinate permease [Aspergillus nomiae NRRL 13137]KNG83988.1 quinate permease [Aspergillus nomiae NRRL 13137]
MGILNVVEDRPTPKNVYNWRVYLLAAIASCGSNMIGYTSAFIGTTITLDSFRKEFGLDKMSSAKVDLISENIVSLFIAGAFFGALFTYPIGHFLGRKWSLVIASAIFTLGAVLNGLGTGVASNIVPIYLSELAPPAIRGRLVGLYELGWQIGVRCPKNMEPGHTQWLIPFAIQLVPSGLLFVGALWTKESPRWLFLKDRRQEAMANLCWIRQLSETDIYITEEVAAIDQALEEQATTIGIGFWKPFQSVGTRPRIMWRLFLGCMLFFWQNGSGINAINYYSPTIFTSIGVNSDTIGITTGLFGVVKAVMTFVWLLFLVDQLGRRKLLLIGAITGSICMWIIGAYICIVEPEKNPTDHLNSGGIAAIFFFYMWTAVYTPTWNGTPWVINSEFFDPNIRSLAQAATTASNWLFNFLVSRFTEQMFDAMGYGVYFFFASLSFLAFFFTFFLIPETSGIPLEVVDRLFEVKPVWRANEKVKAQMKEEEERFRFEIKEGNFDKSEEEHVEDGNETRS